jgi:hypothetical protein
LSSTIIGQKRLKRKKSRFLLRGIAGTVTEITLNDDVIPLTRTFADALFNDFVWARLLG